MDILSDDKREGLGRRAHSRFVLLLLMLVSAILLLFSLYAAEASVFKKARETVVDVSAPILAFFAGPIGVVQNTFGAVEDYFGVMEENKALREENAELRQWMYRALELRRDMAAYEALQSYQAPPDATPIDAHVIGESNDAYAHSMILNVGREGGVERGQAVVDDAGLVGHIVGAGARASRVLLLTDIQSRVPVFVEGADVEGILVGRSEGAPFIEFTSNSEPIALQEGLRVMTSGAGRALPAGLPVGVITFDRDETPLVDIYANYARTRLVRVINYEFPGFDEEELERFLAAPEGELGGELDGAPNQDKVGEDNLNEDDAGEDAQSGAEADAPIAGNDSAPANAGSGAASGENASGGALADAAEG